ncbi:MAG: rRNA pseudouridine synthase [Halieaceae bacterium]|nr:rRNA pseudouridine synthase [Halieaceae bacterium]
MPRLDRHLSTLLKMKRGDVRLLLAQGRVEVDGCTATDSDLVITRFSDVRCDGKVIQAHTARYLMINKPRGIVSATTDTRHRTLIDLLEQTWKDQLHIVGRLDFNSTGLVLLTNDGQWSRRLSLPRSKLLKRYRVRVEKPLSEDHVDGFLRGLYFKYEDITTRPAQLTILSEFEAEVGLVEGRYHQIKRMFGQFDNKVLSIHRFAVGSLTLDSALAPGQSRELVPSELEALSGRVND